MRGAPSMMTWSARRALIDQPLPVMLSEVRQRIVFAESVAAGQLVGERESDCLAAREVAALTREVLKAMSS